jgi:hypothetical protein
MYQRVRLNVVSWCCTYHNYARKRSLTWPRANRPDCSDIALVNDGLICDRILQSQPSKFTAVTARE